MQGTKLTLGEVWIEASRQCSRVEVQLEGGQSFAVAVSDRRMAQISMLSQSNLLESKKEGALGRQGVTFGEEFLDVLAAMRGIEKLKQPEWLALFREVRQKVEAMRIWRGPSGGDDAPDWTEEEERRISVEFAAEQICAFNFSVLRIFGSDHSGRDLETAREAAGGFTGAFYFCSPRLNCRESIVF